MDFIHKKKISPVLSGIILYITFCMSSWVLGRGDYVASLNKGINNQISSMVLIANDVMTFFWMGLLPFLFYELVTWFISKQLRYKIGFSALDLKYSLRFYYSGANICIFLVTLTYFINPLISIIADPLVRFIVPSIFFALFLKDGLKNFVEKPYWGTALQYCGGVFLLLMIITNGYNALGLAVIA